MELIHFHSIFDFLERAQGYLERQEAMNNLILGQAIRLRDGGQAGYLAVVVHGGWLGAALMTPGRGLILSHDWSIAEGLKWIAADLKNRTRQVPSVIGSRKPAECFCECWLKNTNYRSRLHQHMEIYQLRSLAPPALPALGRLRRAVESDLPLVSDWAVAFMQETRTGGEPEEVTWSVRQRVHEGDLFVWECPDGTLAGMIARTRPLKRGISVTLVYTPPELRGQGYASTFTAALCQKLLNSGYEYVALYADLLNPISNSIYRQIGFEPIGEAVEFQFEPETGGLY